jgi:putative FmdB family regulatory protein
MKYDYRCKKCGHIFEGEAKMADPCPECPQLLCGGVTEKLFTRAAPVHFHGRGWAADNYSKGS